MDPDLWKKVDALLDEALAQPPDKREAFVIEGEKLGLRESLALINPSTLTIVDVQAKSSQRDSRSQ